MPSNFEPKLSIFQSPQKHLWRELKDIPQSFVLCGGTAVALHLGHRTSVDFDFFGDAEFDPDELVEAIPFLHESKVLQKSANTLTCLVDRSGPVKISFFGAPKIKQIEEPVIASENGLKVATLLELAGMKAAVVQKRAEAKDYLDIDAIILSGEVDLPMALSAGKTIFGASFNPENTLKALAYYEDGNLTTLSQSVRDRLSTAVKSVELDRLPDLAHDRRRSGNNTEFDR